MSYTASILTGKAGAKIGLEMEVRSFLRGVVLDQCDSMEDLAMWLHFILKPYPMVHQARLLLLLYGPLSRTRGKQGRRERERDRKREREGAREQERERERKRARESKRGRGRRWKDR